VCKQHDIAFNLPFRFEIKSNLEEPRANSQPTPTHAGGDHRFSATAAFGARDQKFRRRRRLKKSDGGGATSAAQGSSLGVICKLLSGVRDIAPAENEFGAA